MYRTHYHTKHLVVYLSVATMTGLLGAGIWYVNAGIWLYVLALALLGVAFGCSVGVVIEFVDYVEVRRQEREDQKMKHERYDPYVEQGKVQRELFKVLNEHIDKAMKMPADVRKYLYVENLVFHDSLIMEKPGEEGYTRIDAHNVLALCKSRYGQTKLPTLYNVPHGSRLYNIIEAVTNDLIELGLAVRQYKTDNAELIVSEDEAMAALFPPKE